MIFGRNTQQVNGALVATIQFVKVVLSQLVALGSMDKALGDALGTILDALTVTLGVYILLIANTRTTPTDDPQLKANTSVKVTDDTGTVLGRVQLPTPPPAPVAQDVPPGTPVDRG